MFTKEQLELEKLRVRELKEASRKLCVRDRSKQQALENRAYKAFYLKIREDIKIIDHLSTVLESPQTHISVETIKQYLNEYEEDVKNG
jgi:hypothetical protein